MKPRSSQRQLLRYAVGILAAALVLLFYYLFEDQIQLLLRDDDTGSAITCTFIDVGQGDSTLITCDGYTILIDAGDVDAWPAIRTTLENKNIQKIDLLVATHPHADHIGSMDDVLANIPVEKIAMSEAAPDTSAFERLLDAIETANAETVFPSAGEEMTYGSVTLQFLHPVSGDTYESLNNYSIVIRMVTPYGTVLFTGDAETLAEKEILASGCTVSADVLKVGHHGSTTSTSAAFLEAVSPAYAVIQVGEGNDYGHPSNKILERLRKSQISIYRTDTQGSITLQMSDAGLIFTTEKEAA